LKPIHAFPLLLLILCATTFTLAQSTDGTISGVVVDPFGKVIPAAEIEILNEATGVHYSSRTNDIGIYTVSILPPGQYRLQVSKAGFKTLIKPGIVLNVQSAVALNFTLPVGATSESVTIAAGTSPIDTTDASVSTVIDRKFVENIPLNGRSFQDLISMTPGTMTQSPQQLGQGAGYYGDFSIDGQRTQSNYYTVDGVSGNTSPGGASGFPQSATAGSVAASTALGTTQALISVDALREFRIESSSYSAEFGRSPGGQISFETRSGTNELHGSAFDYLRNDFFDANDWFNDHYRQTIAPLRQNDFGGTIGGPIKIPKLYDGRDKAFFFGSYEGLRLTQPQAATIQYVPDAFMRSEAPPALQPILNAYPVENGVDYGTSDRPNLAQFIKAYSQPSQIDSTIARLDLDLSARLSLFFRFGDTPSSTSARTLSTVNQTSVNSHTYTVGATGRLASNVNDELRLGYADSQAISKGSLDTFGGAQPINLSQAMGVGTYPDAQPFFLLYISGIGSGQIFEGPAQNVGHQWNLVDTLDLSFGHHQLKVGIDYRRIISPLKPPSIQPYVPYETVDSILTNSATFVALSKYDAATPIFDETSLFLQDQWHVAPSLSLSLGLRWEVDPPPTEEHGNDAYTLSGNINQPASLSLAPHGTPLWRTSWFNLAPRLGVAWIARNAHGSETVVRAGGGVFFDTDNELATQGFVQGIGFNANAVLFNSPLPVAPAQLDFSPSVEAPYTDSIVFAFPPHLQLPYTLSWNASLEQEIGEAQSLTLSYVGANGRRLIQEQSHSIATFNPNFGTVYFVPNGVTSNYQSLQAEFKRNVAHGLQALVSYTWSHSIDFGSSASELPLTRGNSDFDVRHNLQAGMSWDLPMLKAPLVPRTLFNAWGIDARLVSRGAFPVTLQGARQTDPSTGNSYYGNVSLVPGQPIYVNGPQYPGGRSINPLAFTAPAANEPGNASRNFVRGFGATQFNLAARRNVRLSDRLSLEFRAEAFNLLNHPNFGYVDPYLTDITFGQATKMLNQSLGTVSAQYQQGGPRSMQFALKLVF
jgi:hypothetical protein